MCEVCQRLAHPCLLHSPPTAPSMSVGWTEDGPRCGFCARRMHAWGRSFVCGCGQAIDEHGREIRP